MPKDDRFAPCPFTGKVSFTTWAFAAHRAKRAHQNKQDELSVYRCRLCGFYHLGHLPEFLERERRANKHRKREHHDQ